MDRAEILFDCDTAGYRERLMETIKGIQEHNEKHPLPKLDVEEMKVQMEEAVKSGNVIVIDSLGSFVSKSPEELRKLNIIGFGGNVPHISKEIIAEIERNTYRYIGADEQLPPVKGVFKGALTEKRRDGNNKKWQIDRSIRKKLVKASKRRNRK